MRASLHSLCGCDAVLRIVFGLNARRLSFLCVLSIIHSVRGVQAIVPCTVPERRGQRLVLSHGTLGGGGGLRLVLSHRTLGGGGGLRLPLESAVVVAAWNPVRIPFSLFFFFVLSFTVKWRFFALWKSRKCSTDVH